MTITSAMAALTSLITGQLAEVDATVTSDPRQIAGILAAGQPAVLVTPPTLAWPDTSWDIWVIAPTDDQPAALAAIDPILTALADDPDTHPDRARPDTFTLGSGRPALPGYILTITQ